MGFRFRKSVNLGGGFRVNFSKTGVGYSWGGKGFRVTRTAKGTTRTTASIPGTGISYSYELGKQNLKRRKEKAEAEGKFYPSVADRNLYATQNIVNNIVSTTASDELEAMLASANEALRLKKIAKNGFWISLGLGIICFPLFPFWGLISIVFAFMALYVRTKGVVELDYNIEPDQYIVVNSRMSQFLKIADSTKVWRIMQTSKVIDRKYSSGAEQVVDRPLCIVRTTPPFPFKVNMKIVSLTVGKETLLFLPDKLLIIQDNKISALNYNDITSRVGVVRIIESETVPIDASVVDWTWKYVNKSGGPDRRFKDNTQLPICLYGTLELTSQTGLNTMIVYSNPNA